MDIGGWFPLIFNPPFMLYVTIGGIPAVAGEGDFPGMIVAMLLAAAIFGGAVFAAARLQGARAENQ
jgi:hypothetical protein